MSTAIHYAAARYYSAALGRWTSVDPLADQFPSYSPYNYALNNPLLLTDPTGLAPDTIQVGFRHINEAPPARNAHHAVLIQTPTSCGDDGCPTGAVVLAEFFNSGTATNPGKLIKGTAEEDQPNTVTSLTTGEIEAYMTIDLPEGMTEKEFIQGVAEDLAGYDESTNYPVLGVLFCKGSGGCANSNSAIGTLLRNQGIDVPDRFTHRGPFGIPIPGNAPLWNVNAPGLKR